MLRNGKANILLRRFIYRPKVRDINESELHGEVGRSGGVTALKLSERMREWKNLLGLLSPSDTVYTILKHVSRSGMTRFIDLYVFKDNKPVRLSWSASKVLGWTYSRKHDAVKTEGCGMDMGFHLVYSLSRVLFPDGFGEKCLHCSYRAPSKYAVEHCNDNLDEGVTPHEFRGRNGDTSGWDNDGGYALNQRWL